MPTPVEWLNEFQANTGTADIPSVSDPHIIGLSNGNFLVAWVEAGTTGVATQAGNDIVGIIYDAEGNIVEAAQRLNQNFNADDEDDFDIAATNDGGFMLVFVDDDISNSNQESIVWQRHDATGSETNTVTIASNTVGADILSNPTIVVSDSSNRSYVTFSDDVGGSEDIRAVYLGDDGTVLTSEFDAAQNSVDNDRNADSAININGELVTVYQEDDAGVYGIEVQVTNTAGVQQHLVAAESSASSDAHVATLTNGNIVVTWVDGTNVQYRVYDIDLAAVGGPYNVDTSGDTRNEPEIVALPDGGFVIVWDNDTDNTLEMRRFNADGSVNGTDSVVVIEPAAGIEITPNVGVTVDGRILLTWEEGDNIIASIWDTRGTTVDSVDYAALPLNFIEGSVITGGVTSSTINGDGGGDTLLGQGGNDTIFGDGGVDSIEGGAGNDVIEGGLTQDDIDGGSGNDTFIVRNGEFADNIVGGSGTDTLDLSNRTDFAADIDLRSEVYENQNAGNSIEGVEIVLGTQLGDTFRGNNGSTFFGEGGDDTIQFGGGDGFPNYDGGTGTDTADFSLFSSTNFYVDLDGGGYRFGSTAVGAFDGDLIDFESYIGSGGVDFVNGSSGSENIEGGDGNDSLVGNGGADTLSGQGDNDTIFGGSGIDSISGGAGDDVIEGGTFVDDIDGGAGNDTFIVRDGEFADNIDGGDDVDTLDLSNRTDHGAFVDLSTGLYDNQNTGNTIANVEIVIGTQVNDTFRGDSGSVFFGEDGDDTIFFGVGDGTPNFNGGAGTDTADFSLFGGQDFYVDLDVGGYRVGQTTVGAFSGGLTDFENYIGNSGIDVILGAAAANTFEGKGGEDTLSGLGGADTISGGDGADSIDGGKGDDSLEGGKGADVLNGGKGSDVVVGGKGDDTIDAGNGNDDVQAGDGADMILFSAGQGIDTIDGGDGNDTFDGSGATEDMRIDLGAGEQEYNADGTINSFLNIENVYTGSGTDNLTGDADANRFEAGAGADDVSGKGGDDTILGENGHDTVLGGDGLDVIKGGKGDDSLSGEKGDDLLEGGKGDDALFGGKGDDTVRGDNGDDVIEGGKGNDILVGGGGVDDFIFSSGDGNDTINDFDATKNNEDIVLADVAAITNFADLSANHMTQVGDDVLIDDNAGLTITLLDVDLGDLGSADFIF